MTPVVRTKALPPRQAEFVRQYLCDLNASQAAIRAGYSVKTAYKIGPALLRHPGVSQAIEKAFAARAERTALTADWVIDGLREVADRCMERAAVYEGRGRARKVVEGVWTFDAAGATRAYELLGKHLGMFRDRVSHENPDGTPLAAPVVHVTVQAVRP